jgi:hypothetical protein
LDWQEPRTGEIVPVGTREVEESDGERGSRVDVADEDAGKVAVLEVLPSRQPRHVRQTVHLRASRAGRGSALK